jgi:hypothetical protein
MDPVPSWWSRLFDFSAGREEDRRIARVLTGVLQVALAESETDAGFEQCFRQLIKASDGLEAERTWAWLNHRLSDYRRAGEFAPMPRALAARFLRDIPRRYGVKPTCD